jgi:hypothetical protein
MKNRFLGVGLALLCGLTFVGCGDDDDDAIGTDSGMQMTDGGGIMTGTGGMGAGTGGMGAGTGGMGMTGTGGMAATAKPIKCGTNTCQPPAGLGGLLAGFGGGALGGLLPMPVACCMPDNSCGMAGMANGACEMKATPDMRCPPITGGMGMGAGCCTDSGQCGVDGALFGRGCVENSMAAAMLGPLSTFIKAPPASACDAEGDAGTEQDAGH